MAKVEGPTYARASDYVQGIGKSLEDIQNRDVLLHSFTVDTERPMRGDKKTLVLMDISEVDDPDTKVLFHAWSESIAAKLNDIPADASYPLVLQFKRVATAGGFRVWTFE